MQEAFRGVLVCQAPGNPSLPRKARGSRGQETVEGHGSLNVVVEKIDHWEQENPASNGREVMHDFRLPGSRTWRRMGEYSTETRLFTEMAHTFDTHDGSLSEGGALAVVVGDFHETPHWTRDDKHFPHPMRPSEARLRLARPPLARRGGAPHGRSAGGGSDPQFLAADTPRGRGRLFMPLFISCPCPWGSLPPP